MTSIEKVQQIKCTDVLVGLAQLTDDTVDLIVTSPPYNNWRNRRTQARKHDYWMRTNIDYDTYDDKMTDERYHSWQKLVINECMRVLKPTGTMVYNHKDRIFNFEVLSPLTWILESKAVLRQVVIWNRRGMQAFNPVRFYRFEEYLFILGKKAARFKWNNECAKYGSIWNVLPSKNIGLHPATFPSEIPRRCIESFTNESDLVLDPFCGIGTTCIVAKDMNRNYLGFDISENYCKIARERLKIEDTKTAKKAFG